MGGLAMMRRILAWMAFLAVAAPVHAYAHAGSTGSSTSSCEDPQYVKFNPTACPEKAPDATGGPNGISTKN